MSLLKTLLDGNEREVKKLRSIVESKINPLEPQIEKLSNEELAAKTVEFRERLAKGVVLRQRQGCHELTQAQRLRKNGEFSRCEGN